MSDVKQADTATTWQSALQERLTNLSLLTVVIIIIVAACGIVGIGYLLYERDSNRKYDIARPGQHEENEVLTVEDDEADTTSPVTPSAAKQKLENLTKEINGLSSISSFSPEDLNDQNIQLTPPDQPSL